MSGWQTGRVTATSSVETERDDPALEPAPEASPEPKRARSRVRPRWWLELLIIIIGERIYEYIRNLVPTNQSRAESRGWDIERLEQALHLNFGLSLNRFVGRHEPIAQIMNYYYATLHFTVTGGILIWLFVARPAWYRQMRTILVFTTILGLIGFYLYPLCPPRLLPGGGYIDTVVHYKTWGSWADPTIATHSNQYAAMPSLHIAWAIWCGYVLHRISQRQWVMTLAVVYPLLTLMVIISTANHYLLDAVAGAAVFVAAVALERMLRAARASWRSRRGGPPADGLLAPERGPAALQPAQP